MPQATPKNVGDIRDKPLSHFAKNLLICGALLTILAFYFFVVVSIVALVCVLLAEAVVGVLLLRFGLVRMIAPLVERHLGLLMLFLRSFWNRTDSVEYRIALKEADAPKLFQTIHTLSERLKVPAPSRVMIEMGNGACVELRGLTRAAKSTKLVLGYDLLSGLTEQEIMAVLAHEMAHAKLVQRGLSQLYFWSMRSAAKLTGELREQVAGFRVGDKTFLLGEIFLRCADSNLRLTARLVRAGSRQDEFEADLGAAAVCGSALMRSALLKLEGISERNSRISWAERLAILERGEGYDQWLVGELSAAPPAEVETPQAGGIDRYASHPSLRDRIAALPEDGSTAVPGLPGILLLANPHQTAAILVAEIRRIAGRQEEKDSKDVRAWLRKTRLGGHIRSTSLFGVLFLLLGLLLIGISHLDPYFLLAGAGMAASGGAILKYSRHKDRHALPIPALAPFMAKEKELVGDEFTQRQSEIESRLRAKHEGPEVQKKNKRDDLLREGHQALAQCDYLTAHVAARCCLSLDSENVDAHLVLAVAAAKFGQKEQVGSSLQLIRTKTAFRSPSTSWGIGWMFVLLSEWFAAEALLLEAKQHHPENPTVAVLLGLCQSHRGKQQSAIANYKFALGKEPGSTEVACLLGDSLMRAGYVRDASLVLAPFEAAAGSNPKLALLLVRLNLLQKKDEEAARWSTLLRGAGMEPPHLVQLAQAHLLARKTDVARACFEELAEKGFYPEALVGLARISLENKDKENARKLACEAANLTRKVGDKGSAPFDLVTEILDILSSLESPLNEAEAWMVTLPYLQDSPELSERSFLIWAANQPHCERFLLTLLQAMRPEAKPFLATELNWRLAPKDQHPAGTVYPCIHKSWKN